MKVRYLSIAESELDVAIEYYEEQEPGLGLRFFAEVRNTIDRVIAYPDAWYGISSSTKRCRTKIFPYGIIYQIREKEILIVAVAHLHRKPNYWSKRTDG